MKRPDLVSDVPPDTSNRSNKSLGRGGGGMTDNPGIKGISTTPFKRPNVTRADVLKNKFTYPIKGGLQVKNSQPKSSIKRDNGHPPGGFRKSQGKEPVK